MFYSIKENLNKNSNSSSYLDNILARVDFYHFFQRIDSSIEGVFSPAMPQVYGFICCAHHLFTFIAI